MGLVFHWWETLRFQNAIWHAFVLLAALATTSPVVDAVGLLRG
jgi:hemolysin III